MHFDYELGCPYNDQSMSTLRFGNATNEMDSPKIATNNKCRFHHRIIPKSGSSPSSSFYNHFVKFHQNNHFSLLILVLFAFITPNLAECQFPSHWAGVWFQKGVPDAIRILGGNISEKGLCKGNVGDKFFIENRVDGCLRCMVINEKHINVLQYKETYCLSEKKKIETVEDACSEINGDAPLFSLFRLDATPNQCPFLGPFKFSYSRGGPSCSEPLSYIDSCTDSSHLLFKFQACADIKGSESRTEQLECLAEWKEGSVRYLVGKLYYNSAKTDEDKFRCFVFEKEKNGDGYLVAQSGDATCDGLLSPTDGSRTMKLFKSSSAPSHCHFPSFLVSHRHWQTLDRSQIYDFSLSNATFRVFNTTNGEIIRFTSCAQEEQSNDAFTELIVHSTTGCKTGYVCTRIYKRSDQIIEIHQGVETNHMGDACSYFQNTAQISNPLTLTTMPPNLQLKECPVEGVYAVDVVGEEGAGLWIPSSDKTLLICSEQSIWTSKCNSVDHMQLQSRCSSSEMTKDFYCHGGWSENGTNYLIVSSKKDKMQYCLTLEEVGNRAIRMTINSATCQRIHSYGSMIRNDADMNGIQLKLRSEGFCFPSGGSSAHRHHIRRPQLMLNFVLLIAFIISINSYYS